VSIRAYKVATERPRSWWRRAFAVPTRSFVVLSGVPMIAGLAAAFTRDAVAPVLALDLVIVAIALVDLALARGRVEIARSVGQVQAVGRAFEVALRVVNRGRRSLQLRITDDAPGQLDGVPVSIRLPRGSADEILYDATVDRRGHHAFGDVIVRIRSPLGLWEAQRPYVVEDGVRVYPDFAQLRETGLRGRLSEQRVPGRARRRPGGESEFQRLRPYVAGDSYRHIDWKATARRRELVTREFGQESNQNLVFLLDCGRTMSARSGGLSAFDHALNAMVLLGQVALRHRDRVGLVAFDRKVRAWLPPAGGARAASKLIRATYDLEPSLEEPDYALAFRHLAHHVRRRSLVIVLTAVMDEVNGDLATSLVRALGSRHLPLCAWLRDTDLDELLARPAPQPKDVYVRAAAAELVGWRDRALADLRHRGALVVDVAPAELTTGLLHRYLEIKARRLL
jgi:uncharacterized protein (DUF58 family)